MQMIVYSTTIVSNPPAIITLCTVHTSNRRLCVLFCTACSATITRFGANVDTCLNLTVTPSADPAAACTCWADTKLSADVAAVKACNRK